MNVRNKILTTSLLASSIMLVPSLAFADVTLGPNAVLAAQLIKTSVSGNVTVDVNTQIAGGVGFATIRMDADSKFVLFNDSATTTLTSIAGQSAIDISAATAAGAGLLTIGAGNVISSDMNTVAFTANSGHAGLANSGTINTTAAGKAAVNLAVSFGTLTNNAAGIIQNTTAGAGFGVKVSGAATGNIVNAGKITSGANAIDLGGILTGSITNNNGGQILGTAGAGILTTVAITGGITNNVGGLISGVGGAGINSSGVGVNVTNAGTIQGNTTGAVVVTQAGTITNNAGGVIKGTAAGVHGIQINTFAAPQAISVNNTGTISATGAGSRAIQLTTFASTGNITNNTGGVISVDAGQVAIDDTKGFAAITNAGRIDAGSTGTAIQIANTITTPITNTGAIVGNILLGNGTLTLNNGSTLAGNVTGNAANTVTVDMGTGSFTSGGTIDNVANVNFNNGTINWNHTIGAVTPSTVMNLNAGTLNLGANVSATNFNNNGTGTLALVNSLTDTGIYNQTTGNLQVTLTDKNNYGQLKVTGNVNMTAAGKLSIVVPTVTSSNILNGDFFDVVTVGGAVTSDAAVFVPANSLFLTFTKGVSTNGKDIRITAARRGFSTLVTASDVVGVGAALDSILNSPPINPGFRAVFDQIAAFTNTDQVTNALRSLTNDNSGGTQAAPLNTTSRVFNLLTNRLKLVRTASNDTDTEVTGYAAGSEDVSAIWLQAYGVNANQKLRKGIPGYDADTLGAAVGVDSHFGPCLTLGLSGSYSYSDVDTKNGTRNNSKVKSYQGTLYGSFDLGGSFIDGMVSYARLDFDTIRNIAVGAVGFRAIGDFDGNQYGARFAYNMPTKSGNMVIVPSVFAAWSHTNQKAYTERNAGVLALRVGKIDNDVLDIGAGARFEYPISGEHGAFIPELNISVSQDVVGKTIESRNNFVGGGPTFISRGAPVARTTLDTGLGFRMVVNQEFSFSANYDVAFKKNYVGQSGALTARYSF